MRREHLFRMRREDALELLASAPAIHLATTTPDGHPILRTVHGVLVGDAIAFHSAPVGEKTLALGREAVLAAEEIVAPVPSYFLDPELACPATTLYRSVQVHGVLEEVREPALKAHVLQRLMERYQPEGGHRPITHDDPRYRRAVEGLLIVRVSLERLDGKAKLAQNRRPEERVRLVEQLWARGLPGDPRAIELVRDANPDLPTPAFLAAPEGARLVCAPRPQEAAQAAALLTGAYWNGGIAPARIAATQLGSSAWVGARDTSGALVATARALSDHAKRAWIYDVMVAPAWRGRGLGRAVVRLLLDHPAVRGAGHVYLQTRDAQAFYRDLGFVEPRELPPPGYQSTLLALDRSRLREGTV